MQCLQSSGTVNSGYESNSEIGKNVFCLIYKSLCGPPNANIKCSIETAMYYARQDTCT